MRRTGWGQYCPLWTLCVQTLEIGLQVLLVVLHRYPIDSGTGRAPLPPERSLERGDVDVVQQCREPGLARASGRRVHTLEVRQQGLPALCPALRLLRRDPFLPPLLSTASFPSATSSILWSGPTPIRDAANSGCPSLAAPAGDRRRTLMGLIGSGMRLLAVTWSQTPAEHPLSRIARRHVLLSLVRAPALPPQHADFGGQSHTPSNRCLRFGPRVAATPARLAPVLPARL